MWMNSIQNQNQMLLVFIFLTKGKQEFTSFWNFPSIQQSSWVISFSTKRVTRFGRELVMFAIFRTWWAIIRLSIYGKQPICMVGAQLKRSKYGLEILNKPNMQSVVMLTWTELGSLAFSTGIISSTLCAIHNSQDFGISFSIVPTESTETGRELVLVLWSNTNEEQSYTPTWTHFWSLAVAVLSTWDKDAR